MKTKIKYGTIIVLIFAGLTLGDTHLSYKQEMANITIFHHFSTKGENYASTYLRVIIPQDKFHGKRTLNAIYWYIRHLSGAQNRITIVIYDSQEDLLNDESYLEYIF